jgi:flagellar protein FliL
MSAAAAAPADGEAPAKPKSKKLLFIIIGVVVLALLGAGAAIFLMKKSQADEEGGDDTESAQKAEAPEPPPKRDPKTPPTFLPLDSMVVNLADPGGNRFAQLGITLQLADAKTGEDMKTYMPRIRNGILILVSQRTAEQMLRADGKEALTHDIVAEISDVMGYDYEHPDDEPETDAKGKKKKRRAVYNPIEGVLFSSFIVQ